MGRKVHPFIFRIGTTNKWRSRWFNKKEYRELLKQDVRLRDFIMKKLNKAAVESIGIERSANLVNIIIKTARPGLVIGRGGSGVEELKQELKKIINKGQTKSTKTDIRLEVEEIRHPNSWAAIVAQDMAGQIERRFPYRRVMKQTLDKVMQDKGIQGIKVQVKGRLNGAEIARKEWLKKGKISLQTLRADIDYARATAYTTYGTIGIKVWIYKGEIF